MNIDFFDNQLDNYFIKYNENKNEIKKYEEFIDTNKIQINHLNITKLELEKLIKNIEDIFIKEYINDYTNSLYSQLNYFQSINILFENSISSYRFTISCYETNIKKLKEKIEILKNKIYEINKEKKRYIRWNNNYKDNNDLFRINLNNILNKINN